MGTPSKPGNSSFTLRSLGTRLQTDYDNYIGWGGGGGPAASLALAPEPSVCFLINQEKVHVQCTVSDAGQPRTILVSCCSIHIYIHV